ncbi:MAG: HEAT repeat domain-containing protein [Armatimonadetes bacterium]|nr:HEAT repeat domain-containing protein [Armatimonadota bacterium]
MDEPAAFANAPADTLLGKLERGRGAGFIGALAAPRGHARELLTRCTVVDPRWDHQIDDRDEYYGELAVELALPVEPLVDCLHVPESDDRYWGHSLALDVLVEMLRRGRADVGQVLRDYVCYGTDLGHLLWQLAEHTPALLDGLDRVVVSRLDEPGFTEGMSFGHAPLLGWSEQHPRLAALRSEAEERCARYAAERAAWPDFARMSVPELLATTGRGTLHAVRKALCERVQPEDAPLLLAALDNARPELAAAALWALARIADPTCLDRLRELAEGDPEPAPCVRHALGRCLAAIDSPLTLDLGRRWCRAERWGLAVAGQIILAAQATEDDLPYIREALALPMDHGQQSGNVWRVCGALDMLKRLTGIGMLPELMAAYEELPYSYGRCRAVEAMVATAPSAFAERCAAECLWDCEYWSREPAIRRAPISAATRARLTALARSPASERAERRAASRRLRARHPLRPRRPTSPPR